MIEQFWSSNVDASPKTGLVMSALLLATVLIALVCLPGGCGSPTDGNGSSPATPALGAPADGSTDVNTNVSFEWGASSEAASYELQVSASNTFSSLVVGATGLTTTSSDAGGLATTTVYSWRVRAHNVRGSSDWSEVWTFTTGSVGSVPVRPELHQPATGSGGTSTYPELTWNPSPGANNYSIQVATSQAFDSLVFAREGIMSTNTTCERLSHSTTYHWRVKAINVYGASAWSDEWSFTTVVVAGSWFTYDVSNSGLSADYVWTIAIDASDTKWFGTDWSGINSLDDDGWNRFATSDTDSLPYEIPYQANEIVVDAFDNKWFATRRGVYKYDNSSWTVYNQDNSGFSCNQIVSIAVEPSGRLWVATCGGASMFDGNAWTNLDSTNSGIIGDNLTAVAVDSSGGVWYASGDEAKQGFCRFDGTNWITYNSANSGFKSTHVLKIAVDASGRIWFAGHYLTVFDGNNLTVYDHANRPINSWCGAITFAGDGNVWLAEDALLRFDGNTVME